MVVVQGQRYSGVDRDQSSTHNPASGSVPESGAPLLLPPPHRVTQSLRRTRRSLLPSGSSWAAAATFTIVLMLRCRDDLPPIASTNLAPSQPWQLKFHTARSKHPELGPTPATMHARPRAAPVVAAAHQDLAQVRVFRTFCIVMLILLLGHRSRQRITAGGQTTQSQSDERDEGQPSSNDSSGNSGNSNSSNTKSSGSTNPSSTASANISAASETSLLSTATTPAKEQTATYYPPIVSQNPPSPSAPPPLSFDEFVEHVARTRGMPDPGVDYFNARRVLWLLTPPVEPRPISPSPSRIKLEALLNQPGAVESEEVWKAGLKNVWKGLVGGNQLRKRLPLSIVVRSFP